ncbi:oxysterol-binding protein 1-like isoform X2 [Dreissena polymorpha]|uniref:oxysterol-binding protein 1-like isoform X2 n=1 Tax=Dreissena polymorpha TaxID=45954 RepID=UPI00226444C6|nr:oxysterol-binding protein 1-like isoform X2 [Dreissena polymorpha]
MAENKPPQSTYKGWLYKWTNYLKGYQKRWFVLQNGLLSYYRNQAEMTHTCRGTINLASAFITTADSCTIVISSGGNHTFHLKATSEVDRQKWITALELAKADAQRMLEPDSDEEEPDKTDIQTTLKSLGSKMEDLNTCNDLIGKHGSALQRALTELEQLDGSQDVSSKVKVINERATMFRITSNAMINACAEFLELASTDGKKWYKMLEHEYNQKLKLQELLEQCAKEQNSLEMKAKKIRPSPDNPDGYVSGSDGDDDFFDAPDVVDTISLPSHKQGPGHWRQGSDASFDAKIFEGEGYSTESDPDEADNTEQTVGVYQAKTKKNKKKGGKPHELNHEEVHTKTVVAKVTDPLVPRKQRRTLIPAKPNYSLNLWGIMKNCIGKELSKIPMPVNFSEPLSMLQRITEDFEYSSLLDEAAECEDSTEQLAYVTVFTVSSYSTTINRTTKPFNPLLGETYELDHTDDMGWKSLAEQVNHHPPVMAVHTKGRTWTLWQEFTMKSCIKGVYLTIVPTGIAHLVFHKSGNHYTWRKVTTTVHNIIVGKLWVDHHGDMDIKNHKNGDNCHLKYYPYSYFSREKPRKVTGVVTDSSDAAKWVITGTWDTQMEIAQVLQVDESAKRPVFATGPKRIIWKRVEPPPGSEKMYSFTKLAIQLNEKDPSVAPTDARNRPDQRAMEEGAWDEANRLKVQLEEKQRTKRKQMEAQAEDALKRGEEPPCHKPMWFMRQRDEITGEHIYVSNNKYWEAKGKQDWTGCPDIYL